MLLHARIAHFFNSIQCMLHQAHLSKPYWNEAVTCTAYLQNQLLRKTIPLYTTRFELWHKKKPNIVHICVFESRCFAKILDLLSIKLDEKTQACIFLGYSLVSKGYKVQQVHLGAILVPQDVIFWEENSLHYIHVPLNPLPDVVLHANSSFYHINRLFLFASSTLPPIPTTGAPLSLFSPLAMAPFPTL